MATSATMRTDDFSRLVRVHNELDFLIERARRLRRAAHSGHHYLAAARPNTVLGQAYLNIITKQYRTTAAVLEATRVQAIAMLNGTGHL